MTKGKRNDVSSERSAGIRTAALPLFDSSSASPFLGSESIGIVVVAVTLTLPKISTAVRGRTKPMEPSGDTKRHKQPQRRLGNTTHSN